MQIKTCPKCGHQNPLSAMQCEKCGTALGAATSEEPTEPQHPSLDATIAIPDFEFDETIIPHFLDTLGSTPTPADTTDAKPDTPTVGEGIPAPADTVAKPDSSKSIPAATDAKGEKLTSDATIPTRPDFKLVKSSLPDARESVPASTQPAIPPVTDAIESSAPAPAEAIAAKPDMAEAGQIISSPAVSTRLIENTVEENSEQSMGSVRMLGDLILKEEKTGKGFHVPHDQLQEVVIGRMNRETNYVPTIDLTELGAHEKGVSRRHATISNRDNLLVIIDHTSMNGTFLNGQRLVPEQPRVVRDKDTIRIGAITLVIEYQSDEEKTGGASIGA